MTIVFRETSHVQRLRIPERQTDLGHSVGVEDILLSREAQQIDDVYDLTYADVKAYPAPEWALSQFVDAARGRGMAYTAYRGAGEVLARVGTHVSRFLGVPIDPERQLILTAGTQGALFSAVAAVTNPGDTVLLCDPDYLSTERILRFHDVRVRHVPMLESDEGYALDLEKLEAYAAEGARLLVFSNPNNPTGAVHGVNVIQEVARICETYDVVVIVDELYSRLLYDQVPYRHLVAVDGMKERTITLLGPSKAESMSGYRVGVAVGPPDAIGLMEEIQGVAVLRAPAYAQYTLSDWLHLDHDYMTERITEYQRLRDEIVQQFNDSGVLTCSKPKGTSYVFPKLVGVNQGDAALAFYLLRKAKVLVNPGYQFGPRGAGHFRVCFAQRPEVLQRLTENIVSALQRLQ